MSDFFAAGGAGMYPTLVLGFLAIAAGVLYVMRPQRRPIALVMSLCLATLAGGLLGFFMGLIHVVRYLEQTPGADVARVLIAGSEESLHDVALALILVIFAALAAAAGAFRASRLPVAA